MITIQLLTYYHHITIILSSYYIQYNMILLMTTPCYSLEISDHLGPSVLVPSELYYHLYLRFYLRLSWLLAVK